MHFALWSYYVVLIVFARCLQLCGVLIAGTAAYEWWDSWWYMIFALRSLTIIAWVRNASFSVDLGEAPSIFDPVSVIWQELFFWWICSLRWFSELKDQPVTDWWDSHPYRNTHNCAIIWPYQRVMKDVHSSLSIMMSISFPINGLCRRRSLSQSMSTVCAVPVSMTVSILKTVLLWSSCWAATIHTFAILLSGLGLALLFKSAILWVCAVLNLLTWH